MRFLCLIAYSLFSFSLFSQEENLEIVSRGLNQLALGPTIKTNCEDRKKSKTKKENKTNESYLVLALRNDLFAVPISYARNGQLYLLDMGETHGAKIEMGMAFENNAQASISYESRLYTQLIKAHWAKGDTKFDPPISRTQSQTSQTTILGTYSNFHYNDLINFSVGLGIIDFDSKDGDNPLIASTQQKALHNNLDSLIDIQNEKSSSPISGTHGILRAKLIGKFQLPEDLSISPYSNLQLATTKLASNFSSGINFKKEFNITENTKATIGLDLPITIYYSGDLKKLTSFSTPSFLSAIRYKSVEFGFQLEQPLGDWKQNIPQNIPSNYVDINKNPIQDHGEMGTIYFKYYQR